MAFYRVRKNEDHVVPRGGVIIRNVSPTSSGDTRIPLVQIETEDGFFLMGSSGELQSDYLELTSANFTAPFVVPAGATIRMWNTTDESWVGLETAGY